MKKKSIFPSEVSEEMWYKVKYEEFLSFIYKLTIAVQISMEFYV